MSPSLHSRYSAALSALARQLMTVSLAALCLGGCVTWQTRPARVIATKPPNSVRVTNPRGGKIVLYQPFIAGDSLGGFRDADETGRYVTPLSQVARVEVEELDAGRSALAVVGVGVTVALVAAAADGLSKLKTGSSNVTLPAGTLKSCPLVYSWDGRHWRLDSGTFGGAIMEALQRTDLDNLDHATAEGGVLRLRVTNELAEVDHLDALAVLAVDHDPDVTVAPDPAGGIHVLGSLEAPLTARDFRGRDALARVRDADGWSWESSLSDRDPARAADLTDGLELAFVRPHGTARAHLVLDGNSSPWGAYLLGEFISAHGRATQAWYDSMNARPVLARATQARLAREAFLTASLRTAAGWREAGVIWEAGPEVVKRQVLDLDLSQATGDTVVVRLASAPSFWTIDRVAMDFTADRPVTVRELTLLDAHDLGGRDVAPALRHVDHQEYVLRHGDAAVVTFAAPPTPAGLARSYLLRSTGWYRVDSPDTGEPDVAALAGLAGDSLAVGRASVARMNAALARMAAR